MTAGLRRLSPRETEIVGPFALQHGEIVALDRTISDDEGRVSAPLVRLNVIDRLEQRGVISAAEAEAGRHFHRIFRVAALDGLRASDPSRERVGRAAGDLSAANERCRRQVTAAVIALGGGASPAAGAVWAICGLEMSVREWAIASRRPHQLATGILVGGLSALAGHFGERRKRRA